MTKTSTQTTPGAERAASPRRSVPEAILEQCLNSGRAGTERGGKDGPQAGVEVQFTARQCVPTTLDGSRVIERRPRSKTPPESSRWSMFGDQVALDGSRVVRGVRARQPLYHVPIPAPGSNLAVGDLVDFGVDRPHRQQRVAVPLKKSTRPPLSSFHGDTAYSLLSPHFVG